jgi:hypothetical protein
VTEDTSTENENGKPGGYADTARLLSRLAGYPISRQGVWQWWDRRDRSGFPEGEKIPTAGHRREHRVFDPSEVIVWWHDYQRKMSLSSRKSFTLEPEDGIIDLNGSEEPGTGES